MKLVKKVLITGASGGLGKELTKHFSTNGWIVLATMLHLDPDEEMLQLENVFCYELDVCSDISILAAKEKIIAQHHSIDTVINNAGIGYRSFVEESDDQKIEEIIRINWLGVVKVCRAFIPVFKQQHYGQFINVTSIAGLVNLPLGNFYHPTKHAVESFSECMSYELKEANIKICTVQFGNIATHFQQNVHLEADKKWASNNKLKRMIAQFLAKRTGKNKQLIAMINNKIFSIAVHPASNFKRYTIGFDARLLKTLRNLLGYQLFGAIIRLKIANYTKKIEAS
jgi:short-subunit dehydrogenase